MSENLAGDLSALLKASGWSSQKTNPGASELWSLAGQAEMYLPPIVTRGSFLWSDLIERIAEAHEEKVDSVERAIDLVHFDVARFRVDAAPGSLAIPLETGAAVISSAFGMLRAAATAARRPRQSIGSNYSRLGDEIVHEARLTRRWDPSSSQLCSRSARPRPSQRHRCPALTSSPRVPSQRSDESLAHWPRR